ncbi:MAG TPA: hypothetical protein VGI39_28815, partial [Polyangiaceae bacterium]
APEQLTETSWNCEYPAPFKDRLIATCSRDSSLDLYSLPLDGEVPSDWTAEQMAQGVEDADTRVEQQIFASRRLARETTVTGRRRAMLALTLLHLDNEEFRAAEYYAGQLVTVHDENTKGISLPLRTLVEQRRAERRREQGRMMEGFREQAQKRMDALHPEPKNSPMAEDLRHLVRSEIADSIGDETQARSELEAVTVDETTPAPIVDAYYEHADALYRQLDDKDALIAVCRQLSTNGSLTPDEQLRYARAAVRAMVRGLPFDDADALLARERGAPPADKRDAELAFALDLGRALLGIRNAHPPPAVTERLLALYSAQTRPGRRRALTDDAARRADDVDADEVLEALAQRDIQETKKDARERPDAEQLFGRLILGRAYERAAAKRYDDARADFDAVARETDSYEAIVGAVDMRLLKGERPSDIEAEYDRRGANTAPARFAKAYLLARQLPKLEGEAHARAAATAIAALDASWSDLKEERVAQALFGALLHEQYLQTGELGTAERANLHYLVALELVGDSVRFRAMILRELGILHADVGNFRIALGYLLERDKLPYTDDAESLDAIVSKAQALLHVGKREDAATTADAAIAMIARKPSLAPYRLLALDSAAVTNLAAGRFARALAHYDEEIPLLDADHGKMAGRNHIVARIARAAAAVGAGQPARALPDLDDADRRLNDPKAGDLLKWPHATPEHVVRAYRLIVAGLRARADEKLGRHDAEAQATEQRWQMLGEKFDESVRVEVEQQQMLTEAQLALNASRRRDVAATGTWLGRALAHGDDLRTRANGVSGKEVLDVIWLAADLTVAMRETLVPDLPNRVDAAATEIAARKDAALRPYAQRFEVYGALLGLPVAAVPKAPAKAP